MHKWYVWLEHEMGNSTRKMEELHQQKVSQMIESAEGGAGLQHLMTKAIARRGGAQILKKEEEDVRMLDRCEAKRKEWTKHRHWDESVQNTKDKPSENEELKKLGEALPRVKDCDLEKASRLYKAETGVECDGFNHQSTLGLDKRSNKKKSWVSWRSWNKVESGRS